MWLTGPAAPRHVGSSQTRARTCVPCIGRQTLNHCATREALTKGTLPGDGRDSRRGSRYNNSIIMLSESWLPVHRCRNEIWRQGFGGERKGGFILCQAKRGTQQAGTSRTALPSLGNRERSYSQGLWSGVWDKDQGSNSPAFFFLLQSFKRVGLLTRLGCVQGLSWSPNLF